MGVRRALAAVSLAAFALVAQSTGAVAATGLAITMTGPATVNAGSNITYVITITNNGADIAQNVGLSVVATPAGDVSYVTFTSSKWPISPLNPGETVTVTYTDLIASFTPAGTPIVNTATVSATNRATNSATVTTTVGGGARQLVGQGVDAAAVEGASFTGPVATFTDAFPNAVPANYTATITWGDGGSSTGTVVATTTPGAFAVRGTHTYAEEGNFPVSTAVGFPGGTATFTSRGNVADAALHAQGLALPATRLTAFAGTVATFTDADPGGVVGDYTATIYWGDGTNSPGTVSADGTGFKVTGSHTFAQGLFTISTSIRDAGAPVVATSTLTVDLTPPVTTATVNGTFKNGRWTAVDPATLTLTATDNLTGVAATYYTVNLGATTTYTGPVALGPGWYVIRYWSVDGVGNVEAAKTIVIRVKHRPGHDDEDGRGDHGDSGESGD